MLSLELSRNTVIVNCDEHSVICSVLLRIIVVSLVNVLMETSLFAYHSKEATDWTYVLCSAVLVRCYFFICIFHLLHPLAFCLYISTWDETLLDDLLNVDLTMFDMCDTFELVYVNCIWNGNEHGV
jgi:hypothetical protein